MYLLFPWKFSDLSQTMMICFVENMNISLYIITHNETKILVKLMCFALLEISMWHYIYFSLEIKRGLVLHSFMRVIFFSFQLPLRLGRKAINELINDSQKRLNEQIYEQILNHEIYVFQVSASILLAGLYSMTICPLLLLDGLCFHIFL